MSNVLKVETLEKQEKGATVQIKFHNLTIRLKWEAWNGVVLQKLGFSMIINTGVLSLLVMPVTYEGNLDG